VYGASGYGCSQCIGPAKGDSQDRGDELHAGDEQIDTVMSLGSGGLPLPLVAVKTRRARTPALLEDAEDSSRANFVVQKGGAVGGLAVTSTAVAIYAHPSTSSHRDAGSSRSEIPHTVSIYSHNLGQQASDSLTEDPGMVG
jgi:hypothetical protein